ncbi:MAG: rRNA adenine dimethyltransferase family protein, partial [Rhodospirillaceae bacterium]
VANLPYNIATELLLQWLTNSAAFESMTLMFQREVAARVTAPPGTKAYGRLSVMTQWLCDTELLFNVHPRAFLPPPAVDSTVVRLVPLPEPRIAAERAALERVTAAGFGQRRKMLRQSLMPLIPGTAWPDTTQLCRYVDIDPTARAETLSLEQFCALANALTETPKA